MDPNRIPAFAIASGTGPGSPADFLKGDVVVHSWDSGYGQAFVTWTAPIKGTITIAGLIWYAQSAQTRSNDYILTLDGSTLASGTVAYNSTNGFDRAHPLAFSGGGRSRSMRAMKWRSKSSSPKARFMVRLPGSISPSPRPLLLQNRILSCFWVRLGRADSGPQQAQGVPLGLLGGPSVWRAARPLLPPEHACSSPSFVVVSSWSLVPDHTG